jgi:hypothetical protein
MRHKGAAVAVIDEKDKLKANLQALTTAALVLPGLFSPVSAHAAEGDEVDFQYSHYQEGKRNIALSGADPNSTLNTSGKSFDPIEVDSLHGHANISLTDRVKFAFNYIQDTWAGATPAATVPFSTGMGNQAVIKNDVIVGASPNLGQYAIFDSKFNPLSPTEAIDPNTGGNIYVKDRRLTHVMATASPETRKQGDFKLSYDWDNASVTVGGGISIEDDYDSRFGNIGGRFDFNQKQTTVNADLSYTNSYTHATPEHYNFIGYDLVPASQLYHPNGDRTWNTIQGTRQDWATHVELTQVLNKDALLGMDFSYSRSTGYLSNPYKGVGIFFINPDPGFAPSIYGAPQGSFFGQLHALVENRPDVRNQYSVGGRYVQYINALDAALHFNYQFSADDWGIQSHTFDVDWVQPIGNGWIVKPHVRYYSQDAASFYTPYLVSNQPVRDTGRLGSDGKIYNEAYDLSNGTFIGYKDIQGHLAPPSVTITDQVVTRDYDPSKLPATYSSDQRLSGFGALSGGLTVTKQFAKGLTLETGFEYYTHQGGLKIGGGGEGAYANFDYWLANAALKVNLEALTLKGMSGETSSNVTHSAHLHQDHAARGPAGVMFDHMLPAGDFMVGYRFMWNSQSGNMLNGTNIVNDPAIVAGGCGGDPCYLTPSNMTMSMHMLDLMYAPTDWLTLMLMPQFVDMHMDMRGIIDSGVQGGLSGNHGLSGHYTHHIQNAHETGGIGDLGMYALFNIFDNGIHHLHATAGLSAPVGDVDIKIRRTHAQDGGYMDYGMQLGSGTWDFKPSLTYTGHIDGWSWGAQANGILRMESKNKSGYRLGDMFQATAWGGYNLTYWLTASVRGVYTLQGSISGQFNGSSSGGQFNDRHRVCGDPIPQYDNDGNPILDLNGNPISVPNYCDSSILKFGPQDFPHNYGGQFWDVGFGLNATVPGDGLLGGNRISVEWLQPIHTDYNGYQLDRDGALSATWSMAF